MRQLFYVAAAVTAFVFAACSEKKPASVPDASENYVIAGGLQATDTIKSDSTEVADSVAAGERQPSITQYLLVQVVDSGVTLRTPDDIAGRLAQIGFNVRQYNEKTDPAQEAYTCLHAERRNGVEATTVSYSLGKDDLIIVECAGFDEVDNFVASLKKSGYKLNRNIYAHEKNARSRVFVLVSGKTIKIISPAGELPHYF